MAAPPEAASGARRELGAEAEVAEHRAHEAFADLALGDVGQAFLGGRAREAVRLLAIRGLLAAIKQREVDERIDLPEDVASRVYASMQQSFERLARQLRSEGEKDALRIGLPDDRLNL